MGCMILEGEDDGRSWIPPPPRMGCLCLHDEAISQEGC